jgi:hypothetical protein
MADTHAHSSTVVWDALSSLPPLRRGVKLGWRACCGLASVHRLPRPTQLQLGQCLPYGTGLYDTARWGCSPAPGAVRLLPAAQYVERRILSFLESQRLCAAVRMLIYRVSMLHELQVCHVTGCTCTHLRGGATSCLPRQLHLLTHLNCPCGDARVSGVHVLQVRVYFIRLGVPSATTSRTTS